MSISRAHAQHLRDSGISNRVIRARGYETVYRDDAGRDRLWELGYVGAALDDARRPGLLIPLLDKDGQTWGHQYRPDTPRVSLPVGRPRHDARARPKARKYENPRRQEMRLDIPPGMLDRLVDPHRDRALIVTEGVKKADAATSAGYAALALLGVTIWKTVGCIDDWRSLPIVKRDVFICYDSDATTKPEVRDMERKLGMFLLNQFGARVHICRLTATGNGGGKVGLDDYIAAGGDVNDLLANALPLRALTVTA